MSAIIVGAVFGVVVGMLLRAPKIARAQKIIDKFTRDTRP